MLPSSKPTLAFCTEDLGKIIAYSHFVHIFLVRIGFMFHICTYMNFEDATIQYFHESQIHLCAVMQATDPVDLLLLPGMFSFLVS